MADRYSCNISRSILVQTERLPLTNSNGSHQISLCGMSTREKYCNLPPRKGFGIVIFIAIQPIGFKVEVVLRQQLMSLLYETSINHNRSRGAGGVWGTLR